MSDLLILGKNPVTKVGKEFYIEYVDWWIQITEVFDEVLKGETRIDEWFIRECIICPRTPWLDGEESKYISSLLKNKIDEGSMEIALDRYLSEDPMMVNYFNEDENMKQESKRNRLQQIERFVEFLANSGGCRAKWYGVEDDD